MHLPQNSFRSKIRKINYLLSFDFVLTNATNLLMHQFNLCKIDTWSWILTP